MKKHAPHIQAPEGKNQGLGYKTYKKLYDACVREVMDYCSGIWEYEAHEKLDRIHVRALRTLLGVNRHTAIAGIEGEMCWIPPIIRRKICMLKQWNNILKMDGSRWPKKLLDCMHGTSNPWLNEIRNIFVSSNAQDGFDHEVPIINLKDFCNFAEKQLLAHHIHTWSLLVESKPKLHLYKLFKNEFSTERYCIVNLKRSQRALIAKLRLGVFPINVELGRYTGTPREERLCPLCDHGEVEDEIHILFRCPSYKEPREVLLQQTMIFSEGFNNFNDIEKIKVLTSNERLVRKISHYLSKVLCTRQMILRS